LDTLPYLGVKDQLQEVKDEMTLTETLMQVVEDETRPMEVVKDE
jgi:hypothetical protein